ncbi:ATP-binding protein [Olleya sp. 1-3]|uniref:tetratricopeptide repeat-containing sensor histidine kinase n=1 Tax=Olleya sp. 1-3 TaxID=2058323 RepID=UPI0012FE96A8|nr:ATP-binding protein [Olleya sp. 1-3]
MKFIKYSFLFFVFLFVVNKGFAQQKTDSIAYYVTKISQVNTSNDLEKAYQFFQNNKLNALKNKHKVQVVYNLFQLSKIDYKFGFYNTSEANAVEALSILDQIKKTTYNNTLRRSLYNHLGKVYKEKNMYTLAYDKYNQALALTTSALDSLIVYNNISNILKDKTDFVAAEQLLSNTLNMFNRVESPIEKARLLDNLGLVQLKLNKESAFNTLSQALALREASKSTLSLYPSYKSFSKYYLAHKDTAQAKVFALKAYNVANQVNSLSYKLDAIKLRLQLGDYELSNQYFKWNDSLELVKQHNQNKFALLKYNVGQSELKSQVEKTKKQQFQFIALLILVVAISLFFILQSKHKKEKLQEVYATETRISKKVHDEVANDVYQVMTKLQGQTIEKEVVLDDLEHIYIKTRDISRENSTIDVNQDFEDLLIDLLQSYKSESVNIITKDISKIDWKTVSEIKKTTIYRVLQELMTNMKKHSQASIVVLVFNKKNKKIEVNYKDNGVGSAEKKQNGLQNAENRIQSINGTITFDSDINQGFKAFFIV